MKLQIFQSEKGDCLLLEGKDKRLVLCDGGMAGSMRRVVRGALGKLASQGREIEAAYVSHIDQDHISGILLLLQDELDWRVYDYHRKKGHAAKKPDAPRPPKIKNIWHNAFRSQIKDNTGAVEDLLAAAAPVLIATRVAEFVDIGEDFYDIATSIPEAIKVSRLASAEVLDIPINKLPQSTGPAKLLMVRGKNQSFKIGGMKFTIVGPTAKEMTALRDGWTNWLQKKDNKSKVRDIDKQLKKRMDEFTTSAGVPRSIDLRDWNGIPDHKGVSAPNIASLMFMVEEDGKRLLLTGDSQQDIILDGLAKTEFLKNGYLHLDVLKVQHHLSEHNVDANFASVVSADHYVCCGNGQHENPDLGVLEILYKSRMGGGKAAKAPAAAGRKFTMWFSTTGDGKADAHMKKVRKLVDGFVAKSNGRMKAVFNSGDSTTLAI